MVKLEGESRTVLMRPMGPLGGQYGQRQYQQRRGEGGVAQENHKILYRVAQVFPTVGANQVCGWMFLGLWDILLCWRLVLIW